MREKKKIDWLGYVKEEIEGLKERVKKLENGKSVERGHNLIFINLESSNNFEKKREIEDILRFLISEVRTYDI